MIRLELVGLDTANQVCEDYWEVGPDGAFLYTVKQVAQKHNVREIGLNSVIRNSSTAYSTEVFCKNCKRPYVFSNRSDFNSIIKRKNIEWECEDCKAQNAARVRAEQVAANATKQQLIRDTFVSSRSREIDYSDLTLEQAVSLLAFVRLNGSEDYSYIKPLYTATALTPLAATQDRSL